MDIKWMDMPKGHRALSRVHRSKDLVLKYFHEPLDLVAMDLLPGPRTDELLRYGLRAVPPVDRHTDESKLNVWLVVRPPAPIADVMIGSDLLGSTSLPAHAWNRLTEEAKRGIYADGLIKAARDSSTDAPVIRTFRTYLPRKTNSHG